MDAFLVSAVRTPIGKFLGGLAGYTAVQLGAVVIAEAVRRAGVAAEEIDEVIMGQVVQAGTGQAPARQAALRAGLPPRVPAHTTNMVCGSGLKAVMLAVHSIRAGEADLIVAGGMESMSQAPFLLPQVRQGYKYGHQQLVDALVHDGLWCPFANWPMGAAAEHVARTCQISRADQDRFALRSHQRAAAAWAQGAFAAEVVAVAPPAGSRSEPVRQDEGIRPETTLDSLARLKPVFQTDGSVTAGNASQLSDGAAAIVVASGRFLQTHPRVQPMARVVAMAMSGTEPRDLFLAPVPAIRQVCAKAGIPLQAIDLLEVNEAFAAQMLACGQQLRPDGWNEERVNVHGGAIALGHPIGASGARVLTTLLHALQRYGKRYGLAALCLGGGNAVAMIVENLGSAPQ
ncbi:MAG: acetyl-CoA C-acyltransferase [Gemmataceae bacterium]|nr:acetyl-CoA C-acyltransferase [Gemmataceae bacterium]MDW8241996.1 acetyl-CoA C-acyltransferase [Thermogemmata sp.]